jgi:hypothetical protein
MSPSSEAANGAATKEFPRHFMEPENSLPCSQEPSIKQCVAGEMFF